MVTKSVSITSGFAITKYNYFLLLFNKYVVLSEIKPGVLIHFSVMILPRITNLNYCTGDVPLFIFLLCILLMCSCNRSGKIIIHEKAG